jgi:hypothetical protein
MCRGHRRSSLHWKHHFVAAIARPYPHCVAKIFLPEDYSPIILLVIVQDNVQPVTTDLLVAFQFHLPYLTDLGQSAAFERQARLTSLSG